MHYSSFPGRINVEKTFEQCFQLPLLPEKQKAVGRETEIQGFWGQTEVESGSNRDNVIINLIIN